jgi:branched-chain amino acid transport system substrate-binding protein
MRRLSAMLVGIAIGAAVAAVPQDAARGQQFKGEILVGEQCDRTGPTQIVGIRLCAAVQDYVSLVNAKGGVEGWRIRVDEIDHEYKVPPGMEAYERAKRDGAVSYMIYGTPHAQALNQKLQEDKIPGTSPGFGIAASADGKRFPYLFPVAATYWSQAAAAVHFVKEKLGGNLKGKKIAYVFYDNPAGREPIPILEELQKREGFEMRIFAVPPPGVEMGAQVLDITQRYRPDFVINHLFGRSPSVAIKEYRRAGFPLSKVLGLVWASAEADIEAAGGWRVAEGYYTMQFAGAGDDYPIRQEIKEMYKKDGKQPPKEMDDTVVYNRGIFVAALHVEAIRRALQANGGQKPTGEQVKEGFESISDLTLGGLVPPLTITPEDHEGGGWVQIFQVKDGKFVKATDWFRAYRDVVDAEVKKH